MKPKRSLLSGTLLLISFLSFAQQGTLDNSFATGGRMIRNIGLHFSTIASVFQQTDGKIVVAGSAGFLSTSSDFVLARFNSDGTLDPTFDGDGIVRTDINGNSNDFLYSAIQLSTGKILLAGSELTPFLVRYNSDGSLDNTFDGDGKLFLSGINNLRIAEILEQPDGKILIGGESRNPRDFTVIRLTSQGVFDNTFDGDGIAVIDISPGIYVASALALQPGDNKILITGIDADENNSSLVFVTARFNTNGSVDNTFGNAGFVITDAGPALFKEVSDITVQSNGAIILSGNRHNGANNNLSYNLLVRYNPNGTLDTGFDGDGILAMNETNAFMAAGKMVSLADNKIILYGQYKTASGVQGLALQRINTNGTVDNSFGSNGVVQTPVTSGNQYKCAIAQQSDGKLLQAAVVSDGIYFKPAVFRTFATGVTDPSFDIDGVAVFSFTNDPFHEEGVSIAVAGDDSFVAAGYYYNGWGYDGFISRYTSNGAPDLSFGTNGTVSLNEGSYSSIFSSLIQPDGKIVVTGSSYDSWDGFRVVLARYLANGTPDNTFGTNGRVLFAVNAGDNNSGLDIALQNDGKLIVSVFKADFNNSSRQYYLYRFNTNGSIDNSFGIAGRVALDFEFYFSETGTTAKHLVVQPDNKIVIVGVNSDYTKFAVKRFGANGAPDNSFNSGNTLFGDYRGLAGGGIAVALQNDGKIVIIGGADWKIGVCRFMADGAPDLSFNGDGVQIIETGGVNYPSAIYCQPDNKLLITGTIDFTFNTNMLAVKLNTNGSLDNSFGTSGYSIIPGFGAGVDGAYAMAPQSTGKLLLCGYVGLFTGDYDLAVYRINNSIATATSNTFAELKNIVAAPNPVTSKLQISSNQITPGKYNISVRTIEGKQLFSETITTNGNRLQYACSAANWPTGVLLVEIKGEGQFKLFKIVKVGN